MTAQLKIEGDDKLLKGLKGFEGGSRWKELFDTLASYGVSSTQQRFIDQKDPDGNTWKKSGRAKAEGGQTLRQGGDLFRSIWEDTTTKSAAWGSNLIYTAIHQFGGIIKPKNGKKLMFKGLSGVVFVDQVTIPARPFLGVNAEDRAEISELINDWCARPFA
jgi:phage virion morphogenesis protein